MSGYYQPQTGYGHPTVDPQQQFLWNIFQK